MQKNTYLFLPTFDIGYKQCNSLTTTKDTKITGASNFFLNSIIKRYFDAQNLKLLVMSFLTIFTGKNWVILTSVQPFIEIKALLLLAFFVCLHNQLYFIHFVVNFLKVIHQTDRKWTVASFSEFFGKIWVDFCLNRGNMLFLIKVNKSVYIA